MILLYGQLGDPPLSATADALQEAGAKYVLLEQTTLDREELYVEMDSAGVKGTLTVAGERISLDSLRSVYARPLELPYRQWDSTGAERARRLHEQLFEWLEIAPALVVNRPNAMQSNSSKPLQIQLIGESGFLVPETLVTSDGGEAHAFWKRHGRVVYKSTSGIRSIVRELDERAAGRFGLLRALPVQFQEFVPGVDIRVHVTGNRTFAAEIVSSGPDYRYAGQQGGESILTAIELPDEVAGRCVALSRLMGLPLSGIDLRRRPDGEYVCFEVNPMPAYTYFQSHTGLPIGEGLAEMLMYGDPYDGGSYSSHRESDADRGDSDRAPAASLS